eukprot:379377-Prymnesium_polylepis.4
MGTSTRAMTEPRVNATPAKTSAPSTKPQRKRSVDPRPFLRGLPPAEAAGASTAAVADCAAGSP